MGLFSLSRFSAGFIAVLVGYTSSAVIIFQAASAAGASQAEISSWMWALGIGMGITTLGLSLYYRQPIPTAWSTPGAALLITSLSGLSLNEATGAFILSSLLITACGIGGYFERLIRLIPQSLATAMFAGVLFQFGLGLFTSLESQPFMVAAMLLLYLLLRDRFPRYVIPLFYSRALELPPLQVY
jgi:benzoate membrane transport protein